ncbi:GNAT family N-acetyltransferase [Pedobacter frigoris]|uniref:GNAT family N-acetyltransferase n=1 Tax=Pedobacter frigoris TaxID=2571272 RepID=UPI00293026AA|nr:GNAT family N-acetyltransferase [Pedobacter frigoris]
MKHVITLTQKDRWMGYVKRSVNFDFYHTWTYHVLHSAEGDALLFVYEKGSDFIAFPLLKRRIPCSDFFDMSSVYGYSGPISSREFAALSLEFILDFKNALLEFFQEEGIVSVFSRLHPFFNQEPLMEHFEGVVENGKVVALDLTISLDEQRKQYQERAHRKIKQLRKRGYYVKEAAASEDIQTFLSIYTSNMIRLGASDYYMFNEEYFTQLLKSDEYDARLLFVYDDTGYPICGAIIVLTNQIIQAHLLGTRKEYLSDSPAKLLIDEITLLGRELGMKYYNLGGGLGFKEDSLYDWKRSFSDLTFNYQSWRFIVSRDKYNAILSETGIDKESSIDFFPLYRSQPQKV